MEAWHRQARVGLACGHEQAHNGKLFTLHLHYTETACIATTSSAACPNRPPPSTAHIGLVVPVIRSFQSPEFSESGVVKALHGYGYYIIYITLHVTR